VDQLEELLLEVSVLQKVRILVATPPYLLIPQPELAPQQLDLQPFFGYEFESLSLGWRLLVVGNRMENEIRTDLLLQRQLVQYQDICRILVTPRNGMAGAEL